MEEQVKITITCFGVPSIEHNLNIWSISELPGKRGRKVYISAIIHPTAQMSIGLL